MNCKTVLLILCCAAASAAVLPAAGNASREPRQAGVTDRTAPGVASPPPVAPDEGTLYRCCTSSGIFPRYVNPDDRPRAAAREGSFCLAVMPSGRRIPGIVCHS